MRKKILPLFILLIVVGACEKPGDPQSCHCIPDVPDGAEVMNISVSDYRENVLRKEIRFSTRDSSSCYIIFWKEGGKQILTRRTEPDTAHRIILLNLEENSHYSYVIVAEDVSGNKSRSEIRPFQTGSIPVEHDSYGFNSYPHIRDRTFNEYILTHQREENKNLLVILNQNGNIVWYQKFHKNPNVFSWTSRGTIICLLSPDWSLLTESDEIIEINLIGDTLAHIRKDESTFGKGFHHDVILSRNNTIYTLHYDYRIVDFSVLGHNETDTIFCDGITEIDRQGNVLWEWSAFDVSDPLEDPESYVRRNDWLHANSLCEDEDGHLLVSFRHNDQIWKINRSTGELIWKLGRDGDFPLENKAVFSGQHHIRLTADGNIILFDNNNERSRSSVMIFRIDEAAHTAELLYKTMLPLHYYSYIMGSVCQTGGGNLLVDATSAGAISLVDYQGNIIWELGTPGFPYRAEWIEDFNGDYLYCTYE